MSAFVVVDRHSSRGSRDWRLLETELAHVYPAMSVAFPRHADETTALVAAALREGHSEIVAIGGALTDAINGFFDADGAIFPDAVLAVIPANPQRVGFKALKYAPVRPIDIGRVKYLSRDGQARIRYFAATASFGLSAVVAKAKTRTWLAHMLWPQAVWRPLYRGRAVRLIIDNSFDEIVTIASVVVANGRAVAAHTIKASDDSWFDVAITLQGAKDAADIRLVQGKTVIAAPVADTRGRSVLVELDGGDIGRLPATFEILTRALNVRCSPNVEGP